MITTISFAAQHNPRRKMVPSAEDAKHRPKAIFTWKELLAYLDSASLPGVTVTRDPIAGTRISGPGSGKSIPGRRPRPNYFVIGAPLADDVPNEDLASLARHLNISHNTLREDILTFTFQE